MSSSRKLDDAWSMVVDTPRATLRAIYTWCFRYSQHFPVYPERFRAWIWSTSCPLMLLQLYVILQLVVLYQAYVLLFAVRIEHSANAYLHQPPCR